MAIIKSIAGCVIAILVNLFVPQVADVEIAKYPAGPFTLTINRTYRLLLIGLLIYYLIQGIYAYREKDAEKKYSKKAPFRFAIGVALAIWDIAGTKLELLPQPFFPGPAGIAEAFLSDGVYIWQNTLYSLRLFAVGFGIGVVAGIITGIFTGCFKKADYWITPILNICGVVPPVAWMPFALILFPTSFAAAAFLIAICVWFPVATMTSAGIMSTPKTQFEAAKTLGAGTAYQVFTVAIPHAMPQIFTGITTAEAFAFTNLVMAEMMGQPGGLGYYINASKVWSAYYKVFAAIIVMAVLFSLIKALIDRIQNYVLRWQKGIVR